MRVALVCSLTGQPEHGALGLYRDHARRTQLNRLLHDPVHLVATGQGLYQHHLQWRLALGTTPRSEPGKPLFTADNKRRIDLDTRAIEQHQRVTVVQSQDPQRMVGNRLGQGELATIR
ncbi:hypothetical protein SDC9_208327 [bioreactor metagenome]|uniref:Uncharacterized protein n=1 Tax=bioreactor metagenome TaxID=1076179 RepID=A0A645JAB6_9ZZZZ